MTRTNRTPQQVMNDAVRGAAAAGWNGPQGADADHLKTPQDVDRTAAAGFVFFTIDPSGEVDEKADDYKPDQLEQKYKVFADQTTWVKSYEGKSINLDTGTTIDFNPNVLKKAAVKY